MAKYLQSKPGSLEESINLIAEKSVSQAQQMAAGAALAAKRGETSPSSLQGASKEMYDSMTEKELEDFAKTKHDDLPVKKEAVSPAQQAAIAISKKERGEEPKKEKSKVEGTADFIGAASKAAAAGKTSFEFGGKTYPVTIKKDVAKKVASKMEATQVKCPRCGTMNDPSNDKCTNCGLELSKFDSYQKEDVDLEESRKYRPDVLDKVLKIMNPTKSMSHAIPLIAKGMKVDEKEAEQMAKAVLRRETGMKESEELDEAVDAKKVVAYLVKKGSNPKDAEAMVKKEFDGAIKTYPNAPVSKVAEYIMSVSEELDEGKSSTGYELYHKDFSSAMKHAYDHAKKKFGIEIDPQEIDDKVASGPRKPSKGKTNTYRLKGKDGKKAVQIQVYGMDNGKYELNMYKESVELDENKNLIKDYQDMKAQGKKDSDIIDVLMSMPKYKRMDKDQMRKIIGDARRKGIFKEEVELDESKKMKRMSLKQIEKEMDELDKAMEKMGRGGYAYDSMMDAWDDLNDMKKKLKKEEVELDEAMRVLATKGKTKVVTKGDGVARVMVGNKEVASGDLDDGAGGWFMSRKGEKGQKFFDSPKKIADFYAEEFELDEKNYEYKDGKVHISKANFRKIHKDYKNSTKGKERMVVLNPKTQQTVSAPVVFTEESLEEKSNFTDKEIKMAIGVASDKRYKGGNMTGAVNAIEKIKKGLSSHPQVAAVLRRQNEQFKVSSMRDAMMEVWKRASGQTEEKDEDEEKPKKDGKTMTGKPMSQVVINPKSEDK